MKTNIRMSALYFTILLSVTLLLASCSKDASDQTKGSIPPVFYEVIDQVEKARAAQQASILPEMYPVKKYEAQLKEDPKDIWIRLALAYSCEQQQDFRRALDHYLTSKGQRPDIADPLIGLGRVYYKLTQFDMLERKLVKIQESGLPQFFPDERARFMLEEARTLFLEAKMKERLSRRVGDGIMTMSPPGTEDQFLRLIEAKIGTKESR